MANYTRLPTSQRQPGFLTYHAETEVTQQSHNTKGNHAVTRGHDKHSSVSLTLAPSSTAYEPIHLDLGSTKLDSVGSLTSVRDSPSSWTLEIIAIIISTGAVVSIIALLYRENKRPISAWKLAVSLNTVVATLGTLARTTLAFALSACVGQQRWNWLRRRPDSLVAWERFDEASRGPWGGTRLLIWLRARHWATLGALVTVGAVAFDPFLQAVLSTHGQLDNILAGANATIGQSLRLDSGILQVSDTYIRDNANGLLYGLVSTRADFGFISSVWNGFQNTSTFRNDAIGTECSTGNCTWPVFTSAAVCSSCEDVSRDIIRREFRGTNGTNIPPLIANFYEGDYVKFELPYANIRNYRGLLDTTSPHYAPTYVTANTTVHPNRTVSFQQSETLLMAFVIMKAPREYLDGQMKWEDSDPTATECALYLCANAYETKSKNNLVTERIIATWVQKIPGSYSASTSPYYEPNAAKAWIDSLGNTLYDAKIGRTDLPLRVPYEESQHLPTQIQREFNVSHAFIHSAMDFLLEYSKGWLNVLYPSQNLAKSPLVETWGMMGYPNRSTSQSAVMDALVTSTNLTVTFDNVARSITNQIRNSSPDRHRGELKQWVIHVQVEWAYLAYPLTMLVAGILYVVLTILESRRLKMPVWKESSLPTLLHGFDDETQTLLRSESETSRHKVLIRFEDENGCQRLVAQQ